MNHRAINRGRVTRPHQEAPLRWNTRIRQGHRWLSVAFVVAVLANFAAMGQETLALWIGTLTLLPLVLLLLTGAYLFVLPYRAKHRSAPPAD